MFESSLEDDNGGTKLLIKRIIGLPGDTITIENGKVILNGVELQEDYTLEDETPGYLVDFEVPEGQFFVMGDNRRVSIDSRSEEVGCVDEEQIVGKAFVRLYPFSEIGGLY